MNPFAELSPAGARVHARRDRPVGRVLGGRQLRHVPQGALRRDHLRAGEHRGEQRPARGAAGEAEAPVRGDEK